MAQHKCLLELAHYLSLSCARAGMEMSLALSSALSTE
jgi:hypothetical protein